MWLPLFFFVDSNSSCKDLLFPHGPNLAQKPLYLVGTVLKVSTIWARDLQVDHIHLESYFGDIKTICKDKELRECYFKLLHRIIVLRKRTICYVQYRSKVSYHSLARRDSRLDDVSTAA